MITQELQSKFLAETDKTGRFVVVSKRTGRKYFVEPVGDPHTNWGSIDPANQGADGKLTHKKGDGKYRGSVDEKDSLVKLENGFDKVHILEKGTSPLQAIDHLDAQYPSLDPLLDAVEVVGQKALR
jgi:hypothetical protein